MNKDSIYVRQVQLLIRLLPIVDMEGCFALKGGTAINLFYHNLPRLSVDIDLLYLPHEDRDTAVANIRAALSRISERIHQAIPEVKVQNAHEQGNALRLIVQLNEVRVKIELSPVIRESVFPPVRMEVQENVEDAFGYAEVLVASHPDLYAGKICAALDRQHPRDLFDIKQLFDHGGISDDLRKTFIVFLISHQRPMSELLNPNRQDIRDIYEHEFAQMAEIDVPVEELEAAREQLIQTINRQLTEDEKRFLVSFKSKKPDWTLLGLPNAEEVAGLPSVRWKMLNLERMPDDKHQEALNKLKQVLILPAEASNT